MSAPLTTTTETPHLTVAAASLRPPDSSIGAILVGTYLGLILYGLTLHQVHRYSRSYPSDHAWLKFVVSATLILETVHIFLCCHACYYYFITNYAGRSVLAYASWSLKILPLFTGVIIVVSQSFFAIRVRLVAPRLRILVFVAAALLLGELALFCAATAKEFTSSSFATFNRWTWMNSAGVAMAMAADAILTGSLIFTLHRSRTGVRRTDSVLDLLILYAISTGLLTSVSNLITLVFTIVYASNGIYVAAGIVIVKLYANSLLAALNARKSLSRLDSGRRTSAPDAGVYGTGIELTSFTTTLPRVQTGTADVISVRIPAQVGGRSSLGTDDAKGSLEP